MKYHEHGALVWVRAARAVLFLLLALPLKVLALDPERSVFQYNCQMWRRANGLPANGITSITQTSDGLLWLGTSQGLVSFDGIAFNVFDLDPDEGADRKIIASLARRSDGGLWVGLDRGSFGYFDGEHFHSYQDKLWGGSFFPVHSLVETRDGKMLFAGAGAAGNFVSSNKVISMLPYPDADIYSMMEDGTGRVWMGSADRGIFYCENGKITHCADPSLNGQVIHALAMDWKGNLWVGTGTSLRCYDSNFVEVQAPEYVAHPNALLVDQHGVLWVGTADNGLMRYQNGEFTTFRKQDGLASDQVLSLAESDDGSLWVGTADGLNQLSDVTFPTISQTEGLVNASCMAVAATPDGGVWVGTPNGSSLIHNGKITNYGTYLADGFHSSWHKIIFVARNGDAYFIGSQKNIDRFVGDHVDMTWTNADWPRSIAEDSHGILVAIAGNLMRIEADKLTPYRLADGSAVQLNWINRIYVARDDSIWVADAGGMFQIKDGKLYNWCQTNGVYKSTFFNICEGDDGSIWGEENDGIARFKDGKMSVLTRKQGLHEDYVYSMVPDKFGNFWMDSNRGIFRVSQAELNAVAEGRAIAVRCTVYEGEDEVKTTDKTSTEYSGCRSTDGKIWFPSTKGVIMIDPAHLPPNQPPPTATLSSVTINGRSYPPAHSPRLEPGPGNVEFHYSALDFRAPRKVKYRYRLVGFSPEWVDAGTRRSAFFTNLKPGDYAFEVQASNAEGIWSGGTASFSFHLPMHYYETLPVRVSAVLAVMGLGVYIWRSQHLARREAQLQHTQALLEVKVRERTAELMTEIEERERAQAESERLQSELIEASHRAGMAEVATGVLHNVGNVLNSINVSATVLATRLQKSEAPSVGRAAALMQEHAGDLATYISQDPKGRRLPSFLAQLGECLMRERSSALEELAELQKDVEHIKDIVAMQQGFGKVSGVTELVRAQDLVEDSLRMNSSSLNRHDIHIYKDFDAPRVITVERHKVAQILVNLIRNAQDACDAVTEGEKRITIQIVHLADRVRISVTDNGVGITQENLTRIFAHGFTTKKEGHGFGLHSGALAAKEMGGSLSVSSEGANRGATFTLELPFGDTSKVNAKSATVRLASHKSTGILTYR